MPPYFQALYDADLAALRDGLPASALGVTWASGRTLPLERASESAHAVRASLVGPEKDGLTGREVEVLGLVAQGLTDAAVARRLFVSPRTVHAHLRSMYRKLSTCGHAARRLGTPWSRASCKIGNTNRQSCRCRQAVIFRSSERDQYDQHNRRNRGRSDHAHHHLARKRAAQACCKSVATLVWSSRF
jgi:DNA-binding CsgD family transcriptional regulator